MLYPAPSEAFAVSDVRALRRAGARVSVHSLRPATRETKRLREQTQDDVGVSYGGALEVAGGVGYALLHPGVTLRLLSWIFRYCRSSREHLFKSLVLTPRCLGLYARIRRARPDVVHLFWGHYPALVAHLVQETLPDVAVSVFLGAYDLEMRYGGTAPVAKRAHSVWTHAHVNKGAIERLGVAKTRVRVAYRGTDIELARGAAETHPKIKKRVVTAGRLTQSKGMYEVLEAFQKVLAVHPDASLVVLGDGPERPRLEALARKLDLAQAVTFLGHVGHARVLEEMAKAEVFVLMSRDPTERLPNVVKEAMASGCVCVVSPTTGIRELVPDDHVGFVVEGVAEASARMVTLLEHPEHARALARAARAHIETHFDVSATMQTYLDTWRSHLPPRRAKADAASTSSPKVTAKTTAKATATERGG